MLSPAAIGSAHDKTWSIAMSGTSDATKDINKVNLGSRALWVCEATPYPKMTEVFAEGAGQTALTVDTSGGLLIAKECLLTVINTPPEEKSVWNLFVSKPKVSE